MKPNIKLRVICFLDNTLGRDTELVLPLTYCLEKYSDCEVLFFFIWDAIKVSSMKPDVVLLPNTRGHNMYVEIAKSAKTQGITVLALESEGNFRTDGMFPYWGYNRDHIIPQKILTAWSERIKNYLIKENICTPDKIAVTGATGFDRYIFESFQGKQSFLKKYDKAQYKKVVGYAGWAFGKIYGREKTVAMTQIDPNYIKANEWAEYQRIYVREVLKSLATNNPDTLFILKKHPKESYEDDTVEWPNEMNELAGLSNVLYLKKEDIGTIIKVCDLWMGFETTTLIEAWLLNKETILINPDPHFTRASLYKGSLIASDYKSCQNWLNEYYGNGKISSFYSDNLIKNRKQLIFDSIGFSDGMNHLRAYKAFRPYLRKRANNKISINFKHLRLKILMELGKYFFNRKMFTKLPKFKKTIYVFDNRQLNGLEHRRTEVYKGLDVFHSSLNVD